MDDGLFFFTITFYQLFFLVKIPGPFVGEFFGAGLHDWVFCNLYPKIQLQSGLQWAILFSTAVWMLWKWRNEVVFNNGSTNLFHDHVIRRRAAEFHDVNKKEVRIFQKHDVRVAWS